MGYGSLRNVAMHFIEFKSVKNAFYPSAIVTRASRAPILCIFTVSFDTIQKCCKRVVFVLDFIFDERQKDGHSHHTFGFIFDVRQRWSQSYQPIWQRSLETNVVLFFVSFFSKTSASARERKIKKQTLFYFSFRDPTGKLCCQMNLTMNSTIIELSVHACNFVLKVLHREEPGARVWPKLMLKLQPKIAIFQNFTIFTCLLA